jgi:hypothetical protein
MICEMRFKDSKQSWKKKEIEKRILEENFDLREYLNEQEELFKYKKFKFILKTNKRIRNFEELYSRNNRRQYFQPQSNKTLTTDSSGQSDLVFDKRENFRNVLKKI